MLSLKSKQSPNLQPTHRYMYRARRFFWSRTWWVLSRVLMPLIVIFYLGFQIFTSERLANFYQERKEAVVLWVAYLPGLKIEELAIENATRLQHEEVLDALDISMPTSTILLDREELREKLANFDEVGDSSFRFGFNGTLYIDLIPRIPKLIYFDGMEMITVDHEGHKVEYLTDRKERAELFVISGEGALLATEEAIEIVDVLKPYASQIRGLVRMGSRRWDIVLVNDARLMLPAEKPLAALSIILKEHRDHDVLNRDIETYDMRIPARPALRLRDGAAEQIEQERLAEDGQSV